MSMQVAYIFRTDSDVDYLGLDSLAVHTVSEKNDTDVAHYNFNAH